MTANVISDKQIDLSWIDKSTNEIGFKIQRKTGAAVFSDVGSTTVDVSSYSDRNLTPNTSYTYRVYSYNAIGNSATYSNEVTVSSRSSIVAPIVTFANPPLSYFSTEAYCNGYISDIGGELPSEYGACWNTSSNPTIANFKKAATTGLNNLFTVQVTNLIPGTTYYIRAYATNSGGTGYSSELAFTTKVYFTAGTGVTDIDGNNYKTIKLGTQEWMAENLRTTKYANGNIITNGSGNEFSSGTTNGLWCYYENNNSYNNSYGKLYNWYAVNDSRNLCPTGWHIPSNNEWNILINYLEGYSGAGGKLKEAGTTHWNTPNLNANNESGLTALPGGARTYLNTNEVMGLRGFYWSSTQWNTTDAYRIELLYSQASAQLAAFPKANGISVRCIKN